MPISKRPIVLCGLILLWVLTTCLGFLVLGAYQASPGSLGAPADRWPLDSPVPLDKSLPTLLIFIHPRCPCSVASLAELEQVSTRCRGRFVAHVITFRPDGPAEGWDEPGDTPVAKLDGLTRWADLGGREARRFGVETSGHVLLFDPSGRRLFSGGITISRGHQGENPGLDDLLATILDGRAARPRAPSLAARSSTPIRIE